MSEVTNKQKVTYAVLAVALAVALAFAIAPEFVIPAEAKIRCQNPGGQEPQGNCQGNALSRVNPSGHEPPGQNK